MSKWLFGLVVVLSGCAVGVGPEGAPAEQGAEVSGEAGCGTGDAGRSTCGELGLACCVGTDRLCGADQECQPVLGGTVCVRGWVACGAAGQPCCGVALDECRAPGLACVDGACAAEEPPA